MRSMSLPEMALLSRQFVDIGGQQNAFGQNGDDNVTDSEITSYFNLAIPRLWKILTGKMPQNYSFAYYNFPIVSGTSVYPLPADFKTILGVDVALDPTNSNWVSLNPYNIHERNQYSYLQASTFSYVPWSNIKYQLQDLLGNDPEGNTQGPQGGQYGGAISFIPNIGPLPANIRCSYQRAPPILCQTLPVLYQTGMTVVQGQIVYVPITLTNGIETNLCFFATNGGITGGSPPNWNVPGTTLDNGIVWAFKAPLSLFATTFDGIAGWEMLPILDVAIRIGIKQEFDVSGLMAEREKFEASIDSEADQRTAGDPQCISPGWGMQEGSNGWGGGGWGGGM